MAGDELDLPILFKTLAAAGQAAQGNSPYAPFQQALDAVQWNPYQRTVNQSAALPAHLRAAIPDTSKFAYSPGEQAIAGLIKGVLGKGLDEANQGYMQDQQGQALSLMKSVLGGGQIPDQTPQDMSDDAFASLRNNLGAMQLGSGLAAAQAGREDTRKMKEQLLLKAVESGQMSPDDAMAAATGAHVDASGENPIAAKRAAARLTDPKWDWIKTDKDFNKALEVNQQLNLEVPTNFQQQLEKVDKLNEQAGLILPLVKKIESTLTPDQKELNWAQIKAKKILPASDVQLLESSFAPFTAALVSSGQQGRFPQVEFQAFTNALAGDVPLARGLTSKRIADYTNIAKSGIENSLKGYARPGGKYEQSAKFLLDNSKDMLAPIKTPSAAPSPLDYEHTDDGYAKYKSDLDAWRKDNAG